MKKIYTITIIILLLWRPGTGMALSAKTFTGKATNINGNQIMFITPSAAYYTVQIQNISFVRRYGTPMNISEMELGDRLEVTGILRPDNSISASLVKDMSLYTHTGTVSGKIATVNQMVESFSLVNSAHKTFTAQTDWATAITVNGGYATLRELSAGMTVSVKGTWERSSADIHAMNVKATLRLVNIYITGQLVMKGPGAMTVVGNNNAIYGIDIGYAQLQNKNGQPITIPEFGMTDKVRVWGKHISGVAEIYASKVKDTNR